MKRLIVLVGLGLVGAGCNGAPVRGPDEPKEPAAVYEVVLRHELKGANNGAGCYLFIDGKDPAPELLDRLLKQWPELQAGSKRPKGKATSVSLEELKWIDRNTAEVRGGFSNGIDGHHKRYRVIRRV